MLTLIYLRFPQFVFKSTAISVVSHLLKLTLIYFSYLNLPVCFCGNVYYFHVANVIDMSSHQNGTAILLIK